MDVFLVRKLGLPGRPELAMGAIAMGGVRVLNSELVDALRIPGDLIDAVTAAEQRELQRRQMAYRDDLPAPEVRGRTVIVVDDGIATGSTMLAAVAALRKLKTGCIVVAAPTIARATYHQISEAVDDVAAVMVPEKFYGVGQWFEDFSQTTDEEVRELLKQADQRAQSMSR